MLERVPAGLGRALRSARAGPETLVWATASARAAQTIEVRSSAFAAGGELPRCSTADGEGQSPPISWRGVPEAATSVLIIVEDVDSPTPKPLLHAAVYDLPGSNGELPPGALNPYSWNGSGTLGKNSFGRLGWLPPDPPTGHGLHHYAFQVFALRRGVGLPEGASKKQVLSRMRGQVLACGKITGTYERAGAHGRQTMESLKEKVRAKPALDASVSTGFGWLSWSLGLAELFTPNALLDWLGIDRRMAPLLRAFGAREIGAGVAILQNPMGPEFLWARVAGDVLDLAVLGTALRARSRRPDRVDLALAVVGAITVMDVLMSARLTQVSAAKTAKRIG